MSELGEIIMDNRKIVLIWKDIMGELGGEENDQYFKGVFVHPLEKVD